MRMKNAKKTLTLPILLIFLVVVAMLVVHAFSFSTLKVNALEISQAIKKLLTH